MNKELFTQDKYTIRTISMSFLKANIIGTLFPIPLAALFVFLFGWLQFSRNSEGFSFEVNGQFLLWLLVFYVGVFLLIALHEFVHALCFLPGCENRWKSIHFGIKSATPYCHCKEVLPLTIYRNSLLAPLWLICLPLAIAALLTGNVLVFCLTIIMIFGSGGDLAVFWFLRKYKGKRTYVWDKDDAIGCNIYEPLNDEHTDTPRVGS
jgi:hypothetical protein